MALDMGLPDEHVFVVEDGDVICFKNQEASRAEAVYAGRVLVDGKGIGDVGEIVLRERRKLSGHGVVIVLLVVNEQTKEIIYGPDIISRGFVFEDQSDDIVEEAKDIVKGVLGELDTLSHMEFGGLESEIRKRLKRFFYNAIEKNPLILPIIIPV